MEKMRTELSLLLYFTVELSPESQMFPSLSGQMV